MEPCVAMAEPLTGARIIEGCQRGERDAFRLLFETHKDKVYSIALYFFAGDDATASDVTQQVFLKLFDKIGQFHGDSEFTTWLYRLVTNACLDEQRKRRRLVSASEAFVTVEPVVDSRQDETAARAEVSDAVKRAVSTLNPKLRVVMLLKYFEELSYEEIAEVLGCSKGTVASRLNRGHQALARKLNHLRDALIQTE